MNVTNAATQLLKSLDPSDVRLIIDLLALLFVYAIYRLIVRSMSRMVADDVLNGMMAARLRTLLRLAVFLATVVLALHVAGAFEHVFAVVTALLTTIAVGFFALWSVLSNIVCALLILVFRPFQVGDRIEVLEGSAPHPQGNVSNLNLLFVTLEDRTEDGTLVQLQVPNTLFFQKVVRRVMSSGPRSESFFPKSSPVASPADPDAGRPHT